MTFQPFQKHLAAIAAKLLLPAVAACLLTGCASTQHAGSAEPTYRFWVLRYKPAVDANAWVPNPALAADAEGAALNIACAMREGNVDQWLANWETADRPALTREQAQARRSEWLALKGAHFSIIGRVVAESDVIVELALNNPLQEQKKIQIPLKRSKDRWWLTAIAPTSEYLQWENSPNKLIQYIDPDAFQKHLDLIKGPYAQR